MEPGEKSREYIFQGIFHLLNPENPLYRNTLSFSDPVEPELLQKALDRTLDKLPYFRLSLRGDENDLYHVQNDCPCLVYPEGTERKIPEETNGYLFYVSYEGCSLFFRFLHFLTDGFGSYRFMVQIAGEYCRLRYHIDLPDTPYPEEPAFTWEELKICDDHFPLDDNSCLLDRELFRRESKFFQLRMDKNSVIALAKEKNAKPFSCLLALFCEAARRALGKEEIAFCYPISIRQHVGHPNALYNCDVLFRDTVSSNPGESFEQLLRQIDANVRHNLLPESVLTTISRQYGGAHSILQLSAPLKIKKRMFQMTLGSGFPAFLFSYCGKLPLADMPWIEQYLTDFYLGPCREEIPMNISTSEFGGEWICGIWHRYPCDGLPEILRSVMEENHVRVNEIREM